MWLVFVIPDSCHSSALLARRCLVNGRLDLDLDIVEVKDLGRRLGVEVGEFGDQRVHALGADGDLAEHANLRSGEGSRISRGRIKGGRVMEKKERFHSKKCNVRLNNSMGRSKLTHGAQTRQPEVET